MGYCSRGEAWGVSIHCSTAVVVGGEDSCWEAEGGEGNDLCNEVVLLSPAGVGVSGRHEGGDRTWASWQV